MSVLGVIILILIITFFTIYIGMRYQLEQKILEIVGEGLKIC